MSKTCGSTDATVMILGMVPAASAQTVMVRGAVRRTIELAQRRAAGTGTIDATGVDRDLHGAARRHGADEMTPALHRHLRQDPRVTSSSRTAAAGAEADCTRSDVLGIYWVRQRSTIVVNVANPIPLSCCAGILQSQRGGPRGPLRRTVLFGGGRSAQLPNAFQVRCGNVEVVRATIVRAFTEARPPGWRGGLLSAATPSRPSHRRGCIQCVHLYGDRRDSPGGNVLGKWRFLSGPCASTAGWRQLHEGLRRLCNARRRVTDHRFKAEGWGGRLAALEAWSRRIASTSKQFRAVEGDALDDSSATFENRMRTYMFGARVKISRSRPRSKRKHT